MAPPATLRAPATVTALRPGRPPARGPGAFLGGVALLQAAVFGASGLFGGYYDFAVWGAVSAGTLVALTAAAVARPRLPSRPACVVAAGLLALLALSALSLTSADSPDRAWTEVNRLVLYLAAFLLASLALRPGRGLRTVAAVLGAAIGAGALITLARLLAGDPSAFLTFRLNAPVDYINGTACLMLMGIWPLVAYAERDRPPARAGAAVALASLEASLLVLTQSRAVIPAMLGSGLLVLGLIPGRLARLWTVVAVAAGAGAALPWTLAVYSDRSPAHPDGPSGSVVAHAGLAAVVAAAAAGLAWALARRLAARPLPDALRRAPRLGAICLVLAAPVVLLAVDHDPLGTASRQWRAFTALRDVPATATARFTDAGGYRYDLWRVAIEEFDQAPVRGVGAGGYGLRYYQLRENPQSVRQPHSIELQMLAELGLPGLLALLATIGGVLWALARSRRRDAALSVALGGMFSVWLLQTSVDWVYTMPGLTGIALLAAAGLGALAGPEPAAPAPARALRAWTLGVIALVAVGAPSLVRQYLAGQRADRAAGVLAADPRAALAGTRSALRLDDSRPETYYTRAAAFARLGDYPDARATLLGAVRIEPLNYVPWALLGDLATRRGDAAAARAAYRRAAALDPRDAALFTGSTG